MKTMKKMLGIFLALTLLLTMIPAGMVSAADADYEAAAAEIGFDDIKAANANGRFFVTENLNLFTEFKATDGNTYPVSWTSTDESVISTSGVVTVDPESDKWVTLQPTVTDDVSGSKVAGNAIKVLVKAPVAEEDVLFSENFEGFTLVDGTYAFTEDHMYNYGKGIKDAWHIVRPSGRDDIPANYLGTAFSVRDSVFVNNNTTNNISRPDLANSGKFLRMDVIPDDVNGRNGLLTYEFADANPESGIITFSCDFLPSGSSSNFIFTPFWAQKTTAKIKFPYEGGDSAVQYDISFASNTWYHIETKYDLISNTVTGYINDKVYATAEIPEGVNLTKLQMRLQGGTYYDGDYAFVDNIKVTKKTFDAEAAALAAFNPVNQASDYKNSNYVNMDLTKTLTIGGTAYDVTYSSDDTGVISADGTVTLPDFVRYVTVTPSIVVDGTKLSAPAKTLVVLPMAANLGMRLYEDFENIDYITEATEGVEVGDIFNADGSPVDTNSGWTLNLTDNYKTAYVEGHRSQIVTEGSNKVVRMNLVKNSKDFRLTKTIDNPAVGDRTALCMRVKRVSGSMNISSNFAGRLRASDFRADFGGTNTLTDISLSWDNNWHTYMFVYDSGIMETHNNADTRPISLYIDGVYRGTSWSKTTTLSADTFYLMQWGAVGKSEVLVDDLLLMNFDSNAVQLGAATVADGVLTTADVQCVSYESVMPGATKLIAAAYDENDNLIRVKAADANVALVGANAIDLGLDLTGASYYRLFLFDGLVNIKPLTYSKIYNIAE